MPLVEHLGYLVAYQHLTKNQNQWNLLGKNLETYLVFIIFQMIEEEF